VKELTKYIVLFIIAGLSSLPVKAQSPQQRFDKANQLYQQQAYDSAFTLYTQIIEEGYHNQALYFNAGNACYKEGRYSFAVYYYTKALQEAPGNKDITHNLRLAQLQASNKTHQLSTLFFVRWWHMLLHFFSINTWLIGSIVFLWLLVIFVGWSMLSAHPPKFIRKLRIPAAILFCLFFTCSIFSVEAAKSHDMAIIVSVENPLRTAPDKNSSAIEELQNGSKVEIIDSVKDWRKIKLIDGTEGWFNINDMKTL